MTNIAAIFILLFFALTYIQSGYEKVSDWKGNVDWLKEHFAQTPLKNLIPLSLFLLVAMEVLSTAFCIVGIIELYMNMIPHISLYAAILSSTTLLIMLFAQRLAKDHNGAKTIAIYFIPAIIAIYLLQ